MPSERPRARSRFRPFRLFFFLLIIAIAALFEPNTFRFVAAQLIRFEAWRCGVSAQIGSMAGSMLEPLVIRNSVWIYESETGPVTRIEVAEATAVFSWRALVPRNTGPWFQRLTIRGLTGKIQFPLEAAEESASFFDDFSLRIPRPGGLVFPSPERIEANAVDFIFQSNADYVRLADTQFMLSKVEGGTIRAGQLVVKQPWIDRTFRDVRGTTAIQDAVRGTASVPNARVVIANLALSPEVQVRSFSADLDDLARGQLNLNLRLDAFGGDIQVDARTLSSQRPFSFESSANFSQININKLANFLGKSEAAGGTIKQGTFKFRGPPQQVPKATASLRLEATNFQWESRQWDALVLGATLMNGRVQVPELALAQGHNRLNLSGEMPLPTAGLAWWQSEFSVNIAAKIDNLTELSALMLPEFQFAAGKANIDGSIRGKDQQFNGQLIVSGSNLRWHNAPIEELHAGVKLNGNEFQLTNISLFNNGDYLRGHGVVNIIGDKQYWGEVHASIEDLDKYAALLEKPIVPEPLAGGAVIDWSGEGSAKGHSGKFSARLRKLRSLGTTAAILHPINADLDGSYAPGTMQFSRFLLSDDNSSFTANVGVGNKALSLQGIKLYHRQALWLEGDALLPLDVWNSWPNTTLDKLLDDQTVSKVNLTAYNLGLHDATLLTGWKFPIDGVVTGNLVAEGPISTLKTSGKLTLSKATIPLGWSGELLTNVDGEATVEGQTLQVKKLTARHQSGAYSASGQVDFTNLRNPALQLSVTSPDAVLRLFTDNAQSTLAPSTKAAQTHLGGTIQIAGPLSTAAITGDLQLLAMALYPNTADKLRPVDPIDYAPLITGAGTAPLPAPLSVNTPPWSNWTLATTLKTATPITVSGLFAGPRGSENNQSVVEADLRLIGPARAPGFVGTAKFRGGRLAIGATGELKLKDATLTFREGYSSAPSVEGEAEGQTFGESYTLHVTGTLPHPIRTYEFAPPLTEKVILDSLKLSPTPIDAVNKLNLLVPDGLYEDVTLVDWPTIATPPPAPVAPTPAPAPASPAVPTPAPATPASPAGASTTPAATPPAAGTPVPATAPAAPAPAPAPMPAAPAPVPAATAPAVPVPAPAAPAPAAPAPAAPAAAAPAASAAAPASSNTPTTPTTPVPPASAPIATPTTPATPPAAPAPATPPAPK